MQRCITCKEDKPLSEFYVLTDGYIRKKCKKCKYQYDKMAKMEDIFMKKNSLQDWNNLGKDIRAAEIALARVTNFSHIMGIPLKSINKILKSREFAMKYKMLLEQRMHAQYPEEDTSLIFYSNKSVVRYEK